MNVEAPFSNLQMELLKLYSMNISDEQLTEIKHLIARYFADKAEGKALKIWEEQGYSEEMVDKAVAEYCANK